MTSQGRVHPIGRALLRLSATVLTGFLVACGGGTGIGPGEIQKREDRLRDRLPIDWTSYNSGDFQGAIDFFTKTLEQADALEGIEQGVRNQVKAEAQSGIGWAFIRMQDLSAAEQAFGIATQLDRANSDAWVGWAGVSLAQQQYADVVQFSNQALDTNPDYNSATRIDASGRILSHYYIYYRHVLLILSYSYFHLFFYNTFYLLYPNNSSSHFQLVDL